MRSLDAICETFAPGAVEQGVPAAVLDALEHDLTSRERQRLQLLLRTWLPGFSRLSQARREAVLRAWRDSPVPLMRTGFQALRKAALAFAYMLPGRWEQIGYPGAARRRATTRRAPRLEPLEVARRARAGVRRLCRRLGRGRGVAAAVLAAAGLDVVVLEAGGYWSERDFDGAERAGFRRLYRGGGASATDDQGVGADRRRLPRRRHGRQLHDLVPDARRRAAPSGRGSAFRRPTLGASLDAVCERLGVNTDHNRPSRRDEVLRRGLEALGWHVDAMPRNVLGCDQGVVCGYCGYGCPLGAKQSTLRTWLEDAAGAGARIVVGAQGAPRARRGRRRGRRRRGSRAGPRRAVVAAAGAIETPALLLRSGLANANIGRWLRAPPGDRRLRRLRRGGAAVGRNPAGALLRPVPLPRRRLRAQVRDDPAPSGPAQLRRSRGRARRSTRRLMASLPRLSLIAVIPRDSGSGRVRIGRDGEPIVTYRLGADDARRLAAGIDGAGRILAAAGAREIFTAHARMQRWDDGFPRGAFRFGPGRGALYSFHLMGSARMGGSPRCRRRSRPARRGTCGTSSSRTAPRSRPPRASTR